MVHVESGVVFALVVSSIQSVDISADRDRDDNERTEDGESFCSSFKRSADSVQCYTIGVIK